MKRAPYYCGDVINPYNTSNPTESGRVGEVNTSCKAAESPRASGDVCKTSKKMRSPDVMPRTHRNIK